jgi:hypothetical protein
MYLIGFRNVWVSCSCWLSCSVTSSLIRLKDWTKSCFQYQNWFDGPTVTARWSLMLESRKTCNDPSHSRGEIFMCDAKHPRDTYVSHWTDKFLGYSVLMIGFEFTLSTNSKSYKCSTFGVRISFLLLSACAYWRRLLFQNITAALSRSLIESVGSMSLYIRHRQRFHFSTCLVQQSVFAGMA